MPWSQVQECGSLLWLLSAWTVSLEHLTGAVLLQRPGTAAAAAAAACTSYQVLFLIRHAPGNTLSVFHVSHVHTFRWSSRVCNNVIPVHAAG